MRCIHRLIALSSLAVLALLPMLSRADSYQATLLASDIDGLAEVYDPMLVNPWGVSFSATGPFWVSNAGTNTSTVYSGDVNGSQFMKTSTVVNVPGPPTGQVRNAFSPGFGGASFIFAALNGTISSWSSGSTATVQVAVPGAVYTGLAQGTNLRGVPFLYAANNSFGTIDVFDTNYKQVETRGAFTDPHLDPDFVPYNIQNLHGTLYVTYSSQSNPDVGGAVNAFDTEGNLLGRLTTGGSLNAPWGLALAPDGFGEFSNALLVGGFGDGHISAFDPNTGEFLGLLQNPNGDPWVFERLWALIFGNGGSGGDKTTLYLTAGINNQQDGLFASLKLVTGGQ
jgi:uncharacterized protein (TIGR03118 family)